MTTLASANAVVPPRRTLGDRLHRWRRRHWGRMANRHVRRLWRMGRGQPIPLGYWRVIRPLARLLAGEEDPLVPGYHTLKGSGAQLADPALRAMLAGDEMGTWALDVPTADLLLQTALRETPSVVVEFGGGLSTILLAEYARRRAEADHCVRILTLEQSRDVAVKVTARLEALGLSEACRVLVFPVDSAGRYAADPADIRSALQERTIDWMLIDGPCGPVGCRQWTIDTMLPFCRPGTRWFLDDALRDGELHVMRQWARDSRLAVEGILPVGKGLGTGTVLQP